MNRDLIQGMKSLQPTMPSIQAGKGTAMAEYSNVKIVDEKKKQVSSTNLQKLLCMSSLNLKPRDLKANNSRVGTPTNESKKRNHHQVKFKDNNFMAE